MFPLIGNGFSSWRQHCGSGFCLLGRRRFPGSRAFLLADSEWPRVVAESGPILGYANLLIPLTIFVFVARQAWTALKQGQALPVLLARPSGYSTEDNPATGPER